jgi:hypothetical protein
MKKTRLQSLPSCSWRTSNTNTVEIVEDRLAVKPFPMTFDGLDFSIGTIRCGASKEPRRPSGMPVGIGRSMRWTLEEDGVGLRFDGEDTAVLTTGTVTIGGGDIESVALKCAVAG